MQLNPGMKAEYQQAPRRDLAGAGRRCCKRPAFPTIRSISTRRPTSLFGVLWRRDDHGMADLPKHPVMQRWWAHMADIMETRPDNEPVAVPLKPCSIWNDACSLRHVAVIDIGKTNAKVALVDLDRLAEIDAAHDAERGRCGDGPYPHFDVDACGRSSSTAWPRSTASSASTRSRSPRMARRPRCSTRRASWRCRCSTMSMTGPEQTGGGLRCRRVRPSPRPARRACRSASISARSSSGRHEAFPDAIRQASRRSACIRNTGPIA